MFEFKKAQREQLKLRVALIGPSGSGKTYSALRLATGMTRNDGEIVLIDTENRRGEYYAKEFDYDTLNFAPPFTPERYIEAITAAEKAGYAVIILDSASHEWVGKGGLLEIVDKTSGQNSFAKWKTATPRHDAFIDKIVRCECHIIVCLRGKDQYVLEEKNGKQAPKKVGMGAQQRDGLEYECTLSFLIDQATHVAEAAKDNTHIFDGRPDILTEADGEALVQWANDGVAPAQPEMPSDKELQELYALAARKGYDADAVEKACRKKFGVAPEDATGYQFEQMAMGYGNRPDKKASA